jgi:hypothetical protein
MFTYKKELINFLQMTISKADENTLAEEQI